MFFYPDWVLCQMLFYALFDFINKGKKGGNGLFRRGLSKILFTP